VDFPTAPFPIIQGTPVEIPGRLILFPSSAPRVTSAVFLLFHFVGFGVSGFCRIDIGVAAQDKG